MPQYSLIESISARTGFTPHRLLVLMILALVLLLAYGAWQHSPVHAEVQQLPAGIYHWQYGRFDFAEVNPPLLRMVAALPVTMMNPRLDWRGVESNGLTREEYDVGARFVELNGSDSQRLFFAARLACIPFTVVGAFFAWRWGNLLYGPVGGLLAAALWCFSPAVLGHGQFISADIAAASTGLMATFYIRKWLLSGRWPHAFAAGAAVGMAVLTKFTLLLLFPLLVVWVGVFLVNSRGESSFMNRLARYSYQLAAVVLVSLYLINAVYFFEGVPFQARELFLKSNALKAYGAIPLTEMTEAERAPLLSRLWLPLPKSLVRGIDQQKFDFDEPSNCYLQGVWQKGGWWYYYLYGLAIKTPIGTLFLAGLALVTLFRRRPAGVEGHWRDEFLLLSFALAVLWIVSSQTNMNSHVRYAFPLLGAAFVLCSRSVLLLRSGSFAWTLMLATGAFSSAASGLVQHPGNLSFFNAFVGSENGHRYLNCSNVNWGQDLFELRDWHQSNAQSQPLFLSSEALYNPEAFEIEYTMPYRLGGSAPGAATDRRGGPRPGWYAVSRNRLAMRDGDFDYLNRFTPVATVGSAIRIYHLDLQDVNSVRRNAGLPVLPLGWERRYRDHLKYQQNFADELAASSKSNDVKTNVPSVAVVAFDYSTESDDTEERDICRLLSSSVGLTDVIRVEDISEGILSKYDVVVVPGGSSQQMAESLGTLGRRKMQQFVADGGGYIGICAGAFLATNRFEYCLGFVDAKFDNGSCRSQSGRNVNLLDRGSGAVGVALTEFGQKLFGSTQLSFSALYTGGPVYQDDLRDGLPTYAPLAKYRTEIWQCEDQRGTMIQSAAIIASQFQRGRIMLFGFHPEAQKETHEFLIRSAQAVSRQAPR